MKRLTILTAAAMLALVAGPAYAMDLHAARAAGIVGEKTDGYVAVIKPSADAQALAADVNAKRKAEYAKIAATSNQPVDVVAKLAAPQIIGKLDAGDQYQADDGSWKTK